MREVCMSQYPFGKFFLTYVVFMLTQRLLWLWPGHLIPTPYCGYGDAYVLPNKRPHLRTPGRLDCGESVWSCDHLTPRTGAC